MENAENLQLLAGMVWAVVAVVCGVYFVSCYLLEILAQKLAEPRWMAWLPIVNGYLVFRLAGWGGWFGAVVSGWILVGVSAAIAPGFALFLMIPLGIVTLILSLGVWIKIALRRGLSAGVGALVLLPNFAPLLELFLPLGGLLSVGSWLTGLAAFAYLVFYDGLPEESPHFFGYVVTTCLAALIGVPLFLLPGQLAKDPELAARLAEFEAVIDARRHGATEGVEHGWADIELAAEEPQAPPEPAYVPPPDQCAPGAREAGGRPPGGREWWCEAEIAGRWVRHGPARSWYGNGQVESEGTYASGAEQGTWARYWRSGGTKVRAEFADGEQHGWMRRWDELGRLETEVYFERGEPVVSPASR